MTTVKTYRNKRNSNKYIEVHNDGHYHNSVKQYMAWDNGVRNKTGDGYLHRWRIESLRSLLSDYEEIKKKHYEMSRDFGQTWEDVWLTDLEAMIATDNFFSLRVKEG